MSHATLTAIETAEKLADAAARAWERENLRLKMRNDFSGFDLPRR